MNIRKRILISMISLTIGCGVAVLVSSIALFYNEANKNIHEKITVAANMIMQAITDLETTAYVAAFGMSNNPNLIEVLQSNDRDKIASTAQALKTLAHLDYSTVLDREGNVLIRTHDPDNYGDNIAWMPHVRSALDGEIRSNITAGNVMRLSISAGAPIYDERMNIIGATTFGFRLDQQDFVYKLKALTGFEVSLFSKDERVATTILIDDKVYALGINLESLISEKVLAGESYIGQIRIFDNQAIAKYMPIYGANDDIVGVLFVGYYTAEESKKIFTFILYGVLVTLAVFLVCLVIASILSGSIESQMDAMMKEIRDAHKAAEVANRTKSAFLANMSHEIRTPMNSIIGFSELAMDDNIPPKTSDYLEKILKNSKWLLQIINDILDISKVESGKMELENIPFDLHELLASCRTVVMPKALEKGLLMHFYAEPSVGKRLYGDPTRLRQVFVNILSNAIKFTNSGVIKMQGTVKEITEKNVTMYFEIKDSGIGITENEIKRIFDPFVQAEAGITRKYGGSGLGLSITKNIIELMGGVLCVDSTPGVGSKFSFSITFDAVNTDGDDFPAEKQVILNEIEKPMFEGEVLLCEDNEMNRQVICEHLARVGLKTIVAENGKIGVDMVKNRIRKEEKQFDLIFMDIHMPVMDGIEAASKIISLNSNIPIVAMTANIMTDSRNIYKSIGMNDCVCKPFTSQELWRCLMKYFNPITWQKEDAVQLEQTENEMRQKLINNFVKNNQEKFREITDAINAGDIKLAHRLAHTLKGNAGQLNMTLLQEAAREAENNLANGENNVTPQQMSALETELNAALEDLTPLVRRKVRSETDETLDSQSALKLLEEIQPLLEDDNPECLEFIDSLHLIAESDELIERMENLDFGPALEALANLKKKV